MGARHWQIVVIVIALLAVIGSGIYSCHSMEGRVTQASDVTLVDIRNGDLFQAKYPETKPVSYPALRPDSKEAVLYPVYRSENNKWLIAGRFLPDVKKDKGAGADLIVDAKSGEVKVSNAKPVRADVFGK